MALIGERGLAGVSMSLLAERAGVSRATLYHYFPDLDHVLVAWVELQVDRFVGRVSGQVAAEADPERRLEVIVAELAMYFSGQDHRLGMEHLGSEAVAPTTARAVSARMLPLTDLIAGAIREGQQAGRFRPQLDPQVHAELLLGLLGAIRPHLISGRYSAKAAAEAISAMFIHGIAVSGPMSVEPGSAPAPT